MYTVNVIEMELGNFNISYSFQGEDQAKVIKAAVKKFKALVKMACPSVSKDDLACLAEEGYFKSEDGYVDVVLTHPDVIVVK